MDIGGRRIVRDFVDSRNQLPRDLDKFPTASLAWPSTQGDGPTLGRRKLLSDCILAILSETNCMVGGIPLQSNPLYNHT